MKTALSRSLVGRIVVGFGLAYAGVLLCLLVAAEGVAVSGLDRFRGADFVVTRLLHQARTLVSGASPLEADPILARMARRNADLWYVARWPNGGVDGGPAPDWAIRQVAAIPAGTWDDVLINTPSTRPDGAIDFAVIQGFDTAAGPLLLAAGGVDARSPGFLDGLQRWSMAGLFWALLGLALIALPIVGVIAAVTLRTVRPLTQALQALDPDDTRARLPEQGVVRELRPLVAGFNAALARAEAAAERRRRFMADVAHEFRTPLAVLAMHADTLDPSRARDDIQRGLFRLSQMIGQMLDSERLSGSGRARETVDLVPLAKSALAEVAPVAVDAGYELAFAADVDRLEVLGDERALRRAITNLLGNAVAHAGGAGVITVTVSGAGWIDVADQGPGLSEDAGHRVFEPFHRERWDLDGCGLGLHLVREIMTAHGGRAEFVPTPGGATFRLIFPTTGPAGPTEPEGRVA